MQTSSIDLVQLLNFRFLHSGGIEKRQRYLPQLAASGNNARNLAMRYSPFLFRAPTPKKNMLHATIHTSIFAPSSRYLKGVATTRRRSRTSRICERQEGHVVNFPQTPHY